MITPIFLNSIDGIEDSKSHDFTIRFEPNIVLDPNKHYYLALDQISMSHTWYNVDSSYNNNKIKYSHDNGTTWTTLIFSNGNYSYEDFDSEILDFMKLKKHNLNDKKSGIDIKFVPSLLKVEITLEDGY